jgi:hypothetical protein
MALDPMYRSANDWRFVSEVEGSVLLMGFGGQVRLFHFQSEREQVGAWVLFVGLGLGLGMKVKATREGVNALLEIANWSSKPNIKTGSLELALARRKVPHTTLNIVMSDEWFSMSELNDADGSVTSAGVGFGIGVGVLAAKAIKGDKILFVCEKIGAEFGTLGISVSDSQYGDWWVINAWDCT